MNIAERGPRPLDVLAIRGLDESVVAVTTMIRCLTGFVGRQAPPIASEKSGSADFRKTEQVEREVIGIGGGIVMSGTVDVRVDDVGVGREDGDGVLNRRGKELIEL